MLSGSSISNNLKSKLNALVAVLLTSVAMTVRSIYI